VLWSQLNGEGLDTAWIWTQPLRPLLQEPRFLELLRALKLPEYWRVAGWPAFCRAKGENDFECFAR
jgi:hypothetical protein